MTPAVSVQVVQHLRPGGIEVLALDLLSQAAPGQQFLISLEGDANQALKQWPRLKPFRNRLFFLNKQSGISPSLIFRLTSIFKALGATAVHTHHLGPLLYGGLAARLLGIQQRVHTEHDCWHLRSSSAQRLQRVLLKLVRPVLIADCRTVGEELNQMFPGIPTQVIHNGVDTQWFLPATATDKAQLRQRLTLPEHCTLIGCAARLEAVKGINYLLDALSRLPAEVHLALAGQGSQATALKQQCIEQGLAERVHFLGRLDQMPDFYRALDLFCLPSLNEGLPLSPLEAQACDIPTIVTDVGGCRETLCDRSGAIVPPADSHALKEAIVKLCRQPVSVSPRSFVVHNASLERMATRYQQLLYPVQGEFT